MPGILAAPGHNEVRLLRTTTGLSVAHIERVLAICPVFIGRVQAEIRNGPGTLRA